MSTINTVRQTADTILMVRPAHFGYNEQTAASNAFQRQDNRLSAAEIQQEARREFDAFVERLRAAGVEVIVADDTGDPAKPDAVFPNNWVTFHQEGAIVTYPMFAELRRKERREDLLQTLAERFGFEERLRLEQHEVDDRFLEGTGSMILDRPNKIAYACVSDRTDPELLEEFCDRLGYEPEVFHAVDSDGKAIYHTNVMMALGETFVVICLESVPAAAERDRLQQRFDATGKEVIAITLDQMMAFAGNMLQVRNREGDTFLVMSEQAYRSLTLAQIKAIERHTQLLYASLDTIETYGGGSARCMMAEVFYPEPERS